MPNFFRLLYRSHQIVLLILMVFGLQACQSRQPTQLSRIIYVAEEQRESITTEDPEQLAEQAALAPEEKRDLLLLKAATAFIERDQTAKAQLMLDQINGIRLSQHERRIYQINQALVAQANKAHWRVIDLLSEWHLDNIDDITQLSRLLHILAVSLVATGDNEQAILVLLKRDSLFDLEDRERNQRQLLTLIRKLDPLKRSLLGVSQNNSVLNGWIELANLLQTVLPLQRQTELSIWRQHYPHHPINDLFFARLQRINIEQLQRFQRIALLLPLNSSYGAAAQAFYDGFIQTAYSDTSLNRPTITLYDIGSDPDFSQFYFQVAANEGADFVVGPFGQIAVDTLLSKRKSELPTLLIGMIEDRHVAANLFAIGLSPEQNARAVALRAHSDGHRRTAIVRNESVWSRRVANAFTQEWQLLGGEVAVESSLSETAADSTYQLRRLLHIDESITRQRLLSAKLDASLQFIPTRRQDLDFIFLATNAKQARLVTPQLRFHQAHDLPLYATSYVFDGVLNPGLDADLDGIIFGDMPWIIEYITQLIAKQSKPTSPAVTNEAQEMVVIDQLKPASPYRNSPLARLYALGVESYHLIPRLHMLRSNPWEQYHGNSFAAQIDDYGNVVRSLKWAKFKRGLPMLIDAPTGSLLPRK